MFIESERGMWVGQQNTGIKDVVRGGQRPSLSRRVCRRQRRRVAPGIQGPRRGHPPCHTLGTGEEDV
jgi:hypothetical protein